MLINIKGYEEELEYHTNKLASVKAEENKEREKAYIKAISDEMKVQILLAISKTQKEIKLTEQKRAIAIQQADFIEEHKCNEMLDDLQRDLDLLVSY